MTTETAATETETAATGRDLTPAQIVSALDAAGYSARAWTGGDHARVYVTQRGRDLGYICLGRWEDAADAYLEAREITAATRRMDRSGHIRQVLRAAVAS